jgi:hypothetical protein
VTKAPGAGTSVGGEEAPNVSADSGFASATEPARSVSVRTLRRTVIAVLAVAVLAAAGFAIARLWGGLAGFPRGSDATVSLAGVIPSTRSTPMRTPLGAAVSGGILWVTEADRGVVRAFTLNGRPRGVIALPRAASAPVAYPGDIAPLGAEELVVVDMSGRRVLIMRASPGTEHPLVGVVGQADRATAPVQPTAAAVAGDQILVADGSDGQIKVYDAHGRYLRRLRPAITPAVGYIGGIAVRGRRLYFTDSGDGRVLAVDVSSGRQAAISPMQMRRPRGLAVDEKGRVLVADTFAKVVRIFSPDLRRVVDTIDAEDANPAADGGSSGASLAMPTGVAWVARSSRAYVVDSGSGRVKVFNVRAR